MIRQRLGVLKVFLDMGLCLLCAMVVGPSCCVTNAMATEPENVKSQNRKWVSHAEGLIVELLQLRHAKQNDELTLNPSREVSRASEIIWELWLTTGMPPLVQGESSFTTYLSRNATAYRRYIRENEALSGEELHRKGLRNAVDSYGSSLWYMTLKYLEQKAALTSDWRIELRTLPTVLMVESPMPEAAYAGHSAGLAKWLKENDGELLWDPDTNSFRPRSGRYVGTDLLFESSLKSWINASRSASLERRSQE